MNKAAEALLLGLILALGLNHFVLGLAWLPSYRDQNIALLAFGLYLVALVFSIYGQPKLKLTRFQAALNLAITLVVPALALSQLNANLVQPNGSYETWFIAGVSLILSITTARGWPIVGWIGLASLWVQVLLWGGLPVLTTSGLIGAAITVVTAWGLGRGLRSTMQAAESYHRQAADFQSRSTRAIAVRETRQAMLQSTLLTALPMLERIRDQHGTLSSSDRQDVALLELRLRDEIQGHHILNDGIRLATREARKRGVEVAFNDEGGLDHVDAAERSAIQQSIVQAINGTESGKILIHAPKGEKYAVSIIATRPEAAAPDLWLRLP